MDDAKREKREILGQIEEIKSALSDTYNMQQDSRRREEANRELKRQIQLLEARLEAGKRDKEKLVSAQHELRKANTAAEKLEKQKEKLLSSVDSLKTDVRDMKKQLDTVTREGEKAKRHEVSLEDRLKNVEHQRELLITEKQEVVDEISSLRKEYEEARNGLTKFQRDYTNIERELARCNQSRERLMEESEQVKSELRRIRDTTAQLEGQKTAIEEELFAIQKEKQNFEKIRLAKEAMERDIEASQAGVKKLEEERSEQEGAIRDLHGEISHLKKEMEIGKENIRGYEARVSDLTAQAEKLQVTTAELEVEREVYQRQVADLEKRLTEDTEARKEYEHSAADQIETLHQQLTTAEIRVAESEEEKDTLTAQIKSFERSAADRKDQVKGLEKEVDQRGRELSEIRRESNEMERLLHERLGETESALARKTVEAEELQREKERLLKDNEETGQKLTSTRTDLDSERKTYEQDRADWKNIRQELDKTHTIVKTLRDELQELHEEKSELQKQVVKEEFERKEVSAKLDRELSEKGETERRMTETKQELDRANREINALNNQIEKLHVQSPKDEDIVDLKVRKQADEMEHRVTALDSQMKSVIEERNRFQGEVKDRDSEIAQLNRDLMSLREEVKRTGDEAARKYEAEKEAALAEARSSGDAGKDELLNRARELQLELDGIAAQAAAREKELLDAQASMNSDYEKLKAENAEMAGKIEGFKFDQVTDTRDSKSDREKTVAKLANLEAIIAKFDGDDDDVAGGADIGAGIVEKLSRLSVDEVFFEQLSMFFEPGHAFPELGADTINSVITSLRDAVDNNTLETISHRPFGTLAQHAFRVASLSILLAEHQGLPGNKIIEVGAAALLHDIGIQALEPGGMYGKYASPTDRRSYAHHPIHGAEEAEKIGQFSEDILRGIKEHHENMNGSGFPDGLSGGDIHEYAKMISIADRFDRLIHPTSGTEPLLPAMAIKELILETENQNTDGVMLRSLLSCVGLFPIGSFARFKTGEIVRVVGVNAADAKLPIVMIVQNQKGEVLDDPKQVNLATSSKYAISGPTWCDRK
ncbi:MAG: HD domain-containing phosphohydrolase [Planctomycetota bacterium]|jgi:HD-GYP domain-containing protein (c-di-GMP phosphodiesterase class II)